MRRNIFLALAILAIFSGCTNKNDPTLGIRALKNGDFVTAAKRLRAPSAAAFEFATGKQNDFLALSQSADATETEKDESRAAFAEAAEKAAALQYDYGTACYALGRAKLARRAFENALVFAPENLLAKEYLATIDYESGDMNAAWIALTNLLENSTAQTRPRLLNAVARVEFATGQTDVALLRILEAQRLDADNATSKSNYVNICKQAFPAALAPELPYSRPNDEALRLIELAQKSFSRGDLENARISYTRAALADPKSYDAAFGLAKILAGAGQHTDAIDAFKRAATLTNTTPDPIFWQALENYQIADWAETARILTEVAIPRWPNYAESYKLMAYVRFAQKRYDEARLYARGYLDVADISGKTRKAFNDWIKTIPAE